MQKQNYGWQVKGRKLSKRYEFKHFTGAIDFINRVAGEAEKLNHHPDICLSNYKYVTIDLVTHDAGGVTEKDYAMATSIDRLFSTFTSKGMK